MSGLKIAPDLTLPVDAVTQKFGDMGRSGSGKTYGATKRAELMLDAHAQIVALDPVGKWYGLRIAGDGPGYAIPLFGGLHGDIPLIPTAGAIVADLIVDRGISCILDVSQFETDADKARFATAFADRFYFRKKAGTPSAVHLFIEECQEFVPQNAMPGDTKMLHVFERLVKLGRNFGIGISLISQRPQEVNKKALEQVECLFCYQMTGSRSRKAIKEWASFHDLDDDLLDVLPKLPIGEPFVWSPQWLKVAKRIKVLPKLTADVSATPTVGQAIRTENPLVRVDLEKLKTAMAATVESVKSEDPKELHKRIRELETTLSAAGTAPEQEAEIQRRVDEAVYREAERQERVRRVIEGAAEKVVKRARALATAHRGVLQDMAIDIEARIADLADSFEALAASEEDVSVKPVLPKRVEIDPPYGISGASRPFVTLKDLPGFPFRRARPATRGGVPVEVPSNGAVSRPQYRMLAAMASLESIGLARIPRNIVAVLSNQSPRSSGFEKNMSTLRSGGYVSYPDADTMSLTDDGRRAAGPAQQITSLADLHGAWRDKVSGPQWRMCEALIRVYPDSMDRSALAAESQQSVTSSGYEKNLSTLRSLGLLDYPSSSEAVATPLLFPKGLR